LARLLALALPELQQQRFHSTSDDTANHDNCTTTIKTEKNI
jgi:hypothetical protein